MKMQTSPAGLVGPHLDAAALRREALYAIHTVQALRQSDASISTWVNFPLFNANGDADLRLEPYLGEAKPTVHAVQMPTTAGVVRTLRTLGFAVQQARIAVILPGGYLRCHVDMYAAARLIIPLNPDPAHRHLFGTQCVAMQAGEIWAVNGAICHGAGNLSTTTPRVALLIDADLERSTLPHWYSAPWQIPETHLMARLSVPPMPALTTLNSVEDWWLNAPFTYDLTPEQGYASLVAACESKGWQARAQYWRDHSCICVCEE